MKSNRIIFPNKGEVALEKFDLREVGSDDVRVRTLYSLMSIGTETTILHQRYAPDSHFANMFSFPQLKTGVQAIAKVEAIGSKVRDFKVGDSIFMRNAHGAKQVLPAALCSPVPNEIDLKLACWCGLAKTAFRSIWASQLRQGDSILIIGAGPVGQMATRWANASGAGEIGVVDVSPLRLEHAKNGGATKLFKGDIATCTKAISTIDNDRGPSIVIDTTGNSQVLPRALEVAAKYGKVMLLGDTGYPTQQHLTSDVMAKGLSIQATHESHDLDGWTQPKIDQLFFNLVQTKRFDLTGLISHEFSPRDCVDAYNLVDQQREQVMGVLFDWESYATN